MAGVTQYWASLGFALDKLYGALPDKMSVFRCDNCGLRQFSPALEGTAEIYGRLMTIEAYYAPDRGEYEPAHRYLRQHAPQTLLEVGSGRGHFLAAAAAYVPQVKGLELNSKAAEACKAKGLNVEAALLESVEGEYDAIVAFQVLEHVSQPGEFLRTCERRLSKNGRLLVSVPNDEGLLGDIEDNYLNMPPHHLTLWTRRPFEWIARELRLEIDLIWQERLSLQIYQTWMNDLQKRIEPRDGSMRAKVERRLSRLLGAATMPQHYFDHRNDPTGHSMLVCFRKTG